MNEPTPRIAEEPSPAYRRLDLLTALFVAVLLISNVASSKIVRLGPFSFDGGTILFPASYIFGDILTEVYGYRRSRRVIWIGFFAALLMSATFIVVGLLPPGEGWDGQEAYDRILGLTPRIVLASLAAYWAGEFSNSYIMARMKIMTRGRWLFTRTIGSTIVGEGIDTLLFVGLAFGGVLPSGLLLDVALSNYVFKVGVEALATPLTYAVVSGLKKSEQADVYDYGTNFNPFTLGPPARGGSS
jgi:uncharacterized integral membrane protein (TIGR00697 family)